MPNTGITIHWIKINLSAENTYVYPQGADKKKPKYNAYDPEPRWKDNRSHLNTGLTMFNNSPINSAWKVGFINTDYFCRTGCIGNAGAPQGLFVRNNKKFQWTGGPNKRSSLLISAVDYHASIQVFSGGAPDPNNVTGWKHAVSGGPIVLWDGIAQCNPFQETGTGPQSHCTGSFPRTGACISADGRILYLIATAQSTPYSTWTTFMRDYAHCDDGMDFDSNSSTSMVWEGAEMVLHSGQSSVGTGLIVYDTNASLQPGMSKDDFENGVLSSLSDFDE